MSKIEITKMENFIFLNCSFLDKISDFFKETKLNTYICLNPFIKIPKEIPTSEYVSSNTHNEELYFYSKNQENHIKWINIANNMGFSSISYLNEVLMAGEGALARSRRFDYEKLRQDATRLGLFLEEHNIAQLSEGSFPSAYELHFLRSILDQGYSKVIFGDEFDENGNEVNLNYYINFLEKNKKNLDYCRTIGTLDMKINYLLPWDCFYTVLAADNVYLEKIISKYAFDGFYPDEDMTYLL